MEIERKFLISQIPGEFDDFSCRQIEQAYLSTEPVLRIRKEDNTYYLTYKGKGKMIREEYNLPLNKNAYEHLREKADGNIITKTRYLVPLADGLTAEVDLFKEPFSSLILAEVEFSSKEEADQFIPPSWFIKEVTFKNIFQNSYLSHCTPKEFLKELEEYHS